MSRGRSRSQQPASSALPTAGAPAAAGAEAKPGQQSHPKVSSERVRFSFLGFAERKPDLHATVSYELWGEPEIVERRTKNGKVARRTLRCYRITVDGEVVGYVWQQEHRSHVKEGRLIVRTTYPLHWAWSEKDPRSPRYSREHVPGTRRDAVASLLGYTHSEKAAANS